MKTVPHHFRWVHPATKLLLLMGMVILSGRPSSSAKDSTEAPGEVSVLLDLRRVEQQVQMVLPIASQATVALQTGTGTASGVIISPDGLIMTAAHVSEEPGLSVHVITLDGKRHVAKTLGIDTATDAALVRLNGQRNDWPHVDLASGSRVSKPGDWCFAIGHPGGFDQSRGEVLRVGKVIKVTANSLHSDCVLMGGDSGGPLFNLNGELIGIHSLIWEGRDQNVHVSLAPFLRSWDAMLASKVIRTWARGNGAYLGVATRMSDEIEVEVVEVLEDSPAAAAGLKKGDVIVAIDDQPITDQPQFSATIRSHRAGDAIDVTVQRRAPMGIKQHRLPVKLGDSTEGGSQ